MAVRDNPYGAFNFMVKLGTLGGEDQIVGGFSDVSGLGNEVKYSEYRNGNDKENHVRKIANINTTDDVTLKRGVIGDLRLFTWLKATREGDHEPRTVIITLLDEAAHTGVPVDPAARPSRRSGSGRRWPPRAAARWRWRSCTWWPSGSTSSRPDRGDRRPVPRRSRDLPRRPSRRRRRYSRSASTRPGSSAWPGADRRTPRCG